MTRDMLLRHAVPTAVLDRDPRFLANRLEPNLDLCVLVLCKRCVPPAENQPRSGFPHANSTDLEYFAARQLFDEPATLATFETHRTGASRCEPKQLIGLPPECDLSRENIEGVAGRCSHAHGDKNLRSRHFAFFFSR